MRRPPIGLLCYFTLLTAMAPLFAGDDEEDEDYRPGLSASYIVGETTIQRVDPDIAFNWQNSTPDRRLPAGPFQAVWTGRLLLQEPAKYQFHAYVQGRVAVRLDDREVLSGESEEPVWISGPELEWDFGEPQLQVSFTKTARQAQIKLFWSGERFEREPLPAHLLYRDDAAENWRLIEQGRVAFETHRCDRCHRNGEKTLSEPAPSLAGVNGGLTADWIVNYLTRTEAQPQEKMPLFKFDQDKAAAVAAVLLSGKTIESESLPKVKDRAVARRQGEILFRSVGCLACHTQGDEGTNSPYGGGDLTALSKKRSREWVHAWLANPAELNRDHRMPVIKLSKEERAQLAIYLVPEDQSESENEPEVAPETLQRGRELIAAARCANCHHIPQVEENVADIPPLKGDFKESGCLTSELDPTHQRPTYPQVDSAAIRAYLTTIKNNKSNSTPSQFAQGLQLLQKRNCLNCHERGTSKGIVAVAGKMSRLDEALQGQSEALIPPALTAVGDKLKDDALAAAVSGEQRKVRLPWLKVRMPRFSHSDAERDAIAAYFIAHDRIPSYESEAPKQQPKADATQTLIAGHELVGGKGFSCVACHAFGKFAPRDVALGTRGSDLLMIGQRMRREYFLRWTRSPLRIVPGMEMPSFEKPVPGILAGELDRQLAAIWKGLNDPNFTVPTNPAVVEQYLVVRPGEPPRIVRDVFTNHAADGGFTPRAFAVGLPNRHNLLYDLDTFSLRQWWIGDFARQRTQGKSWFWDAAGVTLAVGTANEPDIALRAIDGADDTIISPLRDQGTHGRLLRYRQSGEGVHLEYQLNFANDHQLTVVETLRPLPSASTGGKTGWSRRVSVSGVPEGFESLFLKRSPKVAFGEPHVTTSYLDSDHWVKLSEEPLVEAIALSGESGTAAGTFHYRCGLQPEQLTTNPEVPTKLPIEPITSVPGYDGVRLPLPRSIMPTAITWTSDGRLAFTSLKGHVYIAVDSDGDGLEDQLQLFEEGLAAPYGILADGEDLIVSHKPELLRLRDTNGDGRADSREVIATGWGFNENYHDWTTGIVRDTAGNLYIGLGSDYAQKKRPAERTLWRGKILRVTPSGQIEPLGHDLRYPTGIAIDQFDRVYMSDQQGVQNTFNEVNVLVPGRGYGVSSPHRPSPDSPAMWPAVQLPHPWTRSVNGLFFLNPRLVDDPNTLGPFAGHGVGCEYDTRAIIRFTTQEVGETLQGAAYRLSEPNVKDPSKNFTGALSGAVSADGDLYIGSIHDSGWLGGQNLGDIVRLRPNGKLPLGIRELRANPQGFTLSFTAPIDREAAANVENYTISAYTRVWKGGYATPDSGRHKVTVTAADVSADGKEVTLTVDALQEKFVYDVACGRIGPDPEKPLWPTVGYYTMTVVPQEKPSKE